MATTNDQAPERLRRYLEEAFMAAEERRIRAEENLQREYADADAHITKGGKRRPRHTPKGMGLAARGGRIARTHGQEVTNE